MDVPDQEERGQRAVIIHEVGDRDSQPFSLRQFLLFLGPGFLMSIGACIGSALECM